GATAPLAFYERLAALAAEHDFALASDEAYSELWFDRPPVSALQVAARDNVIVFNTLSKRSSMTGYRSGFVAAAPDVIAALKAYRPSVGTAPQEFVQRASVAAWSDEAHVERTRDVYPIWPPVSALQVAARDNVIVFNTLSKRSSMTGYRSGFVAAAPDVIAALKAYRPSVGTAPQEFVQRASVAAWSDEAHVERTRDVY